MSEEARIYDFHSVQAPPFRIYGLLPIEETGGELRRMPKEVASSVSKNVGYFSSNTTGGRIHFATDADSIRIKAKISGHRESVEVQSAISRCAIDLYAYDSFGDQRYVRTFGFPGGKDPMASESGLEGKLESDGVLTDYVLYLPLYADVYELSIGIPEGSALLPPRYGYRNEAERLADDTVELVYKSIQTLGFMRENFDSETGEGLYADNFASWNILSDKFHLYLEDKGLQIFPWEKE